MPVNSFENYPMSWKPDISSCQEVKYKYLAKLLSEDILSGKLKPGTKLPPQRELADFLDVNVSTISKAFKICEQKGLICGSVGNGTYVSADSQSGTILLPENDAAIIKMGAIIPNVKYNSLINQQLKEMLSLPDSAKLFSYNEISISDIQIQAAKKWLSKAGLNASESQIITAAGGQNGIVACLSSFCKSRDVIGADALTYPGLKSAAKLLGIHIVPIQAKNGEFSKEEILFAIKNEKIKGIYVISDFHNPTGRTMSDKTRKMIAKVAQEQNVYIIEDAINSFLGNKISKPIAYYAPEHTLYISSLSKCIAAGLRIAYMHIPSVLRDKVFDSIYTMNIAVSPLTAELSAKMILNEKAEEIISFRKDDIRKRNELVNDILKGYMVEGSLESPIRFLHLPRHFTGNTFELCAKEAGVQIFGAERFAVGNAISENAVRIAVTTPDTPEILKEGLLRIRKILNIEYEKDYLL